VHHPGSGGHWDCGWPIKARGSLAARDVQRLDVLAEECRQRGGQAITLKAATRRKREVLMGPGWTAVWLRIIAPGLADKITIEMVLKPVVRRAKKAQSTG
jgi:hypothetical protein